MVDSVTDVVINYKSENLDQTVSGIKQTSVALDGLVVASSTTEKSVASLENRFSSLERRFGTSAAQATQFEKIQNQVNQAVANNPALKDRGDDILAAAAAKYNGVVRDSVAAENDLGEAHNKLSTQGQALAHAIRTGITELALGVPVTQVATQQFSHLTFAASGEGGLSGAFENVAGVFGKLISPMTAVIGVTTAVGAAAAYMAVQWDNSQKLVDRSLIGIGQRTGTTATDINNFAKANASAAGLSITEARNVAIEFTKTGDIAVAGLHGVGEAVHGFATLTGTDATEATKKLAGAFSGDLAKGADELNKTYGFLDSTTRTQIQTLQLQGDRMGAVQLIVDKMAPSNIKAAESVGVLTQAWTSFKNVISNIGNLPGPSDQDKLKSLQAARDAAAKTPAVGITPGGYLNTTAAFGGKSAELQALDDQISKLKAKIDSFKTDAAVDELKALSTAGDNVVKSVIPEIDQIDNLQLALKKLRDAQNAPGASRSLGTDDAAATIIQNQLALLQQSKDQAARYAIEVQNISSSWGNVGQSVALQLQTMQNALPVAQAWTEAGKMKAQYEATYLDLLNKGNTAEEASAVASKQQELSKAAAVASAQKLVQSSDDNLEKLKAQGTELEGVVASSIAYRDAIQSGATATQAAAIAANTLAGSMLQAQQAANKMAESATAAFSAFVKTAGGLDNALFGGHGGSTGNFSADAQAFGGHGGSDILSAEGGDPKLNAILRAQQTSEAAGIQSIVAAAFASGGLAGALDAVKAAPNSFGSSSGYNAATGYNLTSILGPERSTVSDKVASYDAIVQAQNSQTTDKSVQNANIQSELSWLRTLPPDPSVSQKIADLTGAISDLTTSTNSLNATNQDLLSPYYTQDPRTSHIGFRSQGMASGGEFTVPGGYSANDNMLAQIPLASGEIVSVRRPGDAAAGGSTQVINVVNNINVKSAADKSTINAIGKTVYQSTQTAARSLQAANR